MNRMMTALLPLSLTVAACADERDKGTPTAGVDGLQMVFGDCPDEEALRKSLGPILDGTLHDYELVSVDADRLETMLAKGEPVALPFAAPNGKTTTVKLAPAPARMVAAGADAYLKDGKGRVVGKESLPTDLEYTLGCESAEEGCGVLNLLDAKSGRVESLVADPKLGVSVMESVASLADHFQLLKDIPESKCAVVYNSLLHADVDPDDHKDDGAKAVTGKVEGGSYQIPIVLDGDAEFFHRNPTTAFSRQRSVLAGVNLIYSFIEPVSSGTFDIEFTIKGQEAWTIRGQGPTTLDRSELTREINQPDYAAATGRTDTEVGYFFVGYDMEGGIAGVAPNLCQPDSNGFGSGADHPETMAWGQQVLDEDGEYPFSTYYGRVVVMAHEIGHVLGGLHGSGSNDRCAGGDFPDMCGTSLMRSGRAGGVAPDFRQPFFTAANDANLVTCVSNALD